MQEFCLTRVAHAVPTFLMLCCLMVRAQSSTAAPGATAAGLNDVLLAKATALYDSSAKAGLRSFDCQVHPDWNRIMTSARKGAAVAPDDPKLALLNSVKISLHAELGGGADGSRLEWQVPEASGKPLDQASTAMLDQTHRGMESTLTGLLKVWAPLVNGSVAGSFGETDVSVAETAAGYTVRTKDGSLTEEFDRGLLLKHFIANEAGTTVDILPAFEPTSEGLRLGSFVAHIHLAGAQAESGQEMRVGIEYQAVSGVQIPAAISIEMPNVVQMDFKFDGCSVNRK